MRRPGRRVRGALGLDGATRPPPALPARASVARGIEPFHESERCRRLTKSGLSVEAMSVPRAKQPTAQALQAGMAQDALDEPAAETPAPLGFQDEDIGEIGETRMVRHDAGKAHLPARFVEG